MLSNTAEESPPCAFICIPREKTFFEVFQKMHLSTITISKLEGMRFGSHIANQGCSFPEEVASCQSTT